MSHPQALAADLVPKIKTWANTLGFQGVGISDTELATHEKRLFDWLEQGRHGSMAFMARHGTRRSRPWELVPGTLSVISVRMDYLPPAGADPWRILADPNRAYISRYALGRDYHKTVRRRLQRLADRITATIGPFGYRVFVDSAPVLEKALAEKAGLGWIGKHTNLLNQHAGSWFFLGELYTDLPLPADTASTDHCGRCRRCLDICPTQAIIAPYRLDARRCISYLTIESRQPIPIELRPLLGNRIYGCDDCQLVCPWNRFARTTQESDFRPRHQLDRAELIPLLGWKEAEFLAKTEGSAIRRIGYPAWLRNIAVALGNAPYDPDIVAALREHQRSPFALVREHVDWALARQLALSATQSPATR